MEFFEDEAIHAMHDLSIMQCLQKCRMSPLMIAFSRFNNANWIFNASKEESIELFTLMQVLNSSKHILKAKSENTCRTSKTIFDRDWIPLSRLMHKLTFEQSYRFQS
jgi:uncharacterized protein YlzI (FlbEa/FlbD family)